MPGIRSGSVAAMACGCASDSQAEAAVDKAQTVAVVLAAGSGRRFGCLKQLLPWGRRPLVRHVAEAAAASAVGQVLVVVGAGATQVEGALTGLPVRLVANRDWAQGPGTSVAAAVGSFPALARRAVFLLCDQPNVTSGLINRCLEIHHASAAPVVMCHDGCTAQPPTVFSAELFDALAQLRAAESGRTVVRRYQDRARFVRVAPREVADIDTPADYFRLAVGAVLSRAVPDLTRRFGGRA